MNAPTPDAAQAQRLRAQAVEHIRSNRTHAAQDVLQDLVRIQPQDTRACLELARLMTFHGQFRASSAPLLAAARHLPEDAPVVLSLAQDLEMRGEVVAARACLDHLSRSPDPAPDMLLELAWRRYGMGEIDEARRLMRRALDAGVDAPGAHLLYASLLEYTGHVDAARKALQACMARWPGYGDAAALYVRLCRQTPEDNQLAHVEEQLRMLPPPGEEPSSVANVAAFEQARFNILDDLGRYEEAWPSLERSKALMHALGPYDAAAERELVDALVGMPPLQPGPHDPARDGDGPVPIFIVGLPRSGSTLLDRMLSGHSQVASAGELIAFWRQLHTVANEPPSGHKSLRRIAGRITDIDAGELGRRYLEQTRWRANGHRYYVDKQPANIQMVPVIRRALPQARIINMVRDPMDACFSNFKLFGSRAAYVNALDAVADYHRLHLRLCARWRELSPDMMLDVAYEDLVRDPRSTMQRVLGYCGLEIEDACLHPERNAAPVATPSSIQVREPIHTRSIGRWKAYASQLRSLRRALDAGGGA